MFIYFVFVYLCWIEYSCDGRIFLKETKYLLGADGWIKIGPQDILRAYFYPSISTKQIFRLFQENSPIAGILYPTEIYEYKVNKHQETFGRLKLFNVYLQCVFHGIRFKVNEGCWLSGDSQHSFYSPCSSDRIAYRSPPFRPLESVR